MCAKSTCKFSHPSLEGERYCYQPETQLCLPYMPGTYEEGKTEQTVEPKCYPNTVSCFFETKKNCPNCMGNTGPCRTDTITVFNQCLPHQPDAAAAIFRDEILKNPNFNCDLIPKPRTCQTGTLPCGELSRPLIHLNCPQSMCAKGSAGPCHNSKTGECTPYKQTTEWMQSNGKEFTPGLRSYQSFQQANAKGEPNTLDFAEGTCPASSMDVTYTDCGNLQHQCPAGHLCRRNVGAAEDGYTANQAFDEVTVASYSEGTTGAAWKTRQTQVQVLTGDLDDDGVDDIVLYNGGEFIEKRKGVGVDGGCFGACVRCCARNKVMSLPPYKIGCFSSDIFMFREGVGC